MVKTHKISHRESGCKCDKCKHRLKRYQSNSSQASTQSDIFFVDSTDILNKKCKRAELWYMDDSGDFKLSQEEKKDKLKSNIKQSNSHVDKKVKKISSSLQQRSKEVKLMKKANASNENIKKFSGLINSDTPSCSKEANLKQKLVTSTSSSDVDNTSFRKFVNYFSLIEKVELNKNEFNFKKPDSNKTIFNKSGSLANYKIPKISDVNTKITPSNNSTKKLSLQEMPGINDFKTPEPQPQGFVAKKQNTGIINKSPVVQIKKSIVKNNFLPVNKLKLKPCKVEKKSEVISRLKLKKTLSRTQLDELFDNLTTNNALEKKQSSLINQKSSISSGIFSSNYNSQDVFSINNDYLTQSNYKNKENDTTFNSMDSALSIDETESIIDVTPLMQFNNFSYIKNNAIIVNTSILSEDNNDDGLLQNDIELLSQNQKKGESKSSTLKSNNDFIINQSQIKTKLKNVHKQSTSWLLNTTAKTKCALQSNKFNLTTKKCTLNKSSKTCNINESLTTKTNILFPKITTKNDLLDKSILQNKHPINKIKTTFNLSLKHNIEKPNDINQIKIKKKKKQLIDNLLTIVNSQSANDELGSIKNASMTKRQNNAIHKRTLATDDTMTIISQNSQASVFSQSTNDQLERLSQLSDCTIDVFNNVQDIIKSSDQLLSTITERYKFNETSVQLSQAFTETEEFLQLSNSDIVNSEETITDYVNTLIKLPEDTTVEIISNNFTTNNSNVHYKKIGLALDEITKDESLFYHGPKFKIVSYEKKKILVLEKIKNIFHNLADDIDHERPLMFKYRTYNWKNTVMVNGSVAMKPVETVKFSKVNQNRKNSLVKFRIIVFLLRKIYNMAMMNTTCNKRELYYEIINFVINQQQVTNAIQTISSMLNIPTWDLGILTTSKGLVYGDLKIHLKNNVVTFTDKGGTLIPQDIRNLTKIESNAQFILIIEKDSMFQKLLKEDVNKKLSRPFIFVTGKGFPDVNTRLFLKIIWKLLSIPVFILVDADPYGIEIMFNYRFGSMRSSDMAEHLAMPNIRWLGVHPSEIKILDIRPIPLTPKDVKKINLMLKRPYIDLNPGIKEQLNLMLRQKFKVEIEGLIKHNYFISDSYLPNKICSKGYI